MNDLEALHAVLGQYAGAEGHGTNAEDEEDERQGVQPAQPSHVELMQEPVVDAVTAVLRQYKEAAEMRSRLSGGSAYRSGTVRR